MPNTNIPTTANKKKKDDSIMSFLVFARVIHVISVVLWIGGVAFMTTVVIPSLRKSPDPQQRWELFEKFENRCALQAKFVTAAAAISGVIMIVALNAWQRYLDLSYWWMHVMSLVWLIFTLILFVFEPLFLNSWFRKKAQSDSEAAFRFLQRMHWILLTLSLVAIIGAVAGVRGYLRFG